MSQQLFAGSTGAVLPISCPSLTGNANEGAEGIVIPVPGTTQVAKIFKKSLDPAYSNSDPFLRGKANKIALYKRLNITHLYSNGVPFIALPEDSVLDQHGKLMGILMPRVVIKKTKAGTDVNIEEPTPGLAKRIQIAAQLAHICATLHERDVLLIDWNPQNFVVSTQGKICVIDCDNFQMTDGHQLLPATAYSAEWCAPEILRDPDRRYPGVQKGYRTVAEENWSLALMLHQVLCGCFPFYGNDNHRVTWILQQQFTFTYNEGPPRSADQLCIWDYPNDICGLFCDAFIEGYNDPSVRPSARMWLDTFIELTSKPLLAKCKNNHSFFANLHICPVCYSGKL